MYVYDIYVYDMYVYDICIYDIPIDIHKDIMSLIHLQRYFFMLE